MAVIAVAIVPHTPLLVPAVGRDHRPLLKRTTTALEQLDAELYALQPETIIVLTPHGQAVVSGLTAFVSETVRGTLEHFGDFTDRIERPGAATLAQRLKSACRQHRLPFQLTTVNQADYGTTVPLLLLPETSSRVSVLPLAIHHSSADWLTHYGQVLWDECHRRRNRIVILVSANLSHRQSTTNHSESTYDQQVVEAIRSGQPEAITAIDPRVVADAHTCSHEVLQLGASLLQSQPGRPRRQTYEMPLGVGELTAYYPMV